MIKKYLSGTAGRLQAGFTLIEVLTSVAIAGLLATGIAMSISQVISVNASSNSRMQAIKQIEVVIDRLRIDVQMAQEFYLTDPGDPNAVLVLVWTDWDNITSRVSYSLDPVSHELNRLPAAGTLNTVAQDIESIEVSRLDSGNWGVTITALVEGYKSATESRTFEVLPRTGA